MHWIGIIVILAALFTMSANATDASRPCYGLLAETGGTGEALAQDMQILLTDAQCDSLKSRELRLPLLEIPQKEDDPIALTVGLKGAGIMFRFKIPFSF